MQDEPHLRWQQQSLPAVHTATQVCSEPGFLSKAQQEDFLPTKEKKKKKRKVASFPWKVAKHENPQAAVHYALSSDLSL